MYMYIQLLSTAEEVAKLQAELEEMQPQLEQAQIATEQTMEKIKQDSGTYVYTCILVYMYSMSICILNIELFKSSESQTAARYTHCTVCRCTYIKAETSGVKCTVMYVMCHGPLSSRCQ